MTKIADIHARHSSGPLFICDFSPPRGAVYDELRLASPVGAHCLSIPYNPGKSVYASSVIAAHSVRSHTGREVAFTIASRDMNILAIQSLLLGAALLGLENAIVVRGDDFTASELRRTKPVHDWTPTALIRSIAKMNNGTDFRGRQLSTPTDFCIGATIDANRSLDLEVSLTHRKTESGAHFFITQPGYSPERPLRFLQTYEQRYGHPPSAPIFFGIQMISPGGRSFSSIPMTVRDDLGAGVAPADIASRVIDRFLAADITTFYLMPPILPGGARDHQAAQSVLDRYKER